MTAKPIGRPRSTRGTGIHRVAKYAKGDRCPREHRSHIRRLHQLHTAGLGSRRRCGPSFNSWLVLVHAGRGQFPPRGERSSTSTNSAILLPVLDLWCTIVVEKDCGWRHCRLVGDLSFFTRYHQLGISQQRADWFVHWT